MRFIPLEEAIKTTGHPSKGALDRWIRRWNSQHPHRLILRRQGCVEEASLKAALSLEVEMRTPGFRAAKAIAELAKGGQGA
jgi:hypothetical protein